MSRAVRRRSILVGVVVVLVAALLPRLTLAQVAGPSIDVAADFVEAAATVGDRVRLTVRVTHPDDVVVTVQRPIVREFEYVSAAGPETESLDDGVSQTVVTYTFQVFTLGEAAPIPVAVNWVDEEGTTGRVETSSRAFVVAPTRPPGDQALRPVPPPLAIEGAPPGWLVPLAYGASAVVGMSLLVVVVFAWRRRPPRTVALPPDMDIPEQSARERLAAVRSLHLGQEADFQRYYGTIAEVVREYLGQRFMFNAVALTTSELEARMRLHGVDRWQARLVSGLLDRCDRAVYARQYPDPASADHDLTVAYEIVELSRPRTGMTDDADVAQGMAS